MSDVEAYLFVTLGIVVAVLLPVLSTMLRKEFPAAMSEQRPAWIRRYALLFGFSLIVALPALAIWKSQSPAAEDLRWFTAFLVGFGWESALEKFLRPGRA